MIEDALAPNRTFDVKKLAVLLQQVEMLYMNFLRKQDTRMR